MLLLLSRFILPGATVAMSVTTSVTSGASHMDSAPNMSGRQNIISALSTMPRPMRMATMAAPPIGNIAATATTVVINGTAILTASSAAEPMPCPDKYAVDYVI